MTSHVQIPLALTTSVEVELNGGLIHTRPELVYEGLDTSHRLSNSQYWVFFTYGFTFLLPWNAVLVAIPYFITRIQGTGLENSFTSWIVTTASIGLLAFLWHATVTSHRPTASIRAIQSLLWTALLNLQLLIMVFVPISPNIFALLVLLNGIAQNAAAAYLQTAFWVIGALFGAHALQALSVGSAAVGATVGALQVISTYLALVAKGEGSSPPGIEFTKSMDLTASFSAIVLFAVTTIFLFGNMALQMWLTNTKEYLEFVLKPEHSIPMEEMEGLMQSEARQSPPQKSYGLSAKEMLWVNGTYNAAIMYVFIITMMLFPAVTGFVTSVNSPNTIWSEPILFSSLQFFSFNLGDFFSRYFPVYPSLFITSPRKLAALSYARTAFVPLFLMCNVSPETRSPVINSDIVFMLLVFLFGFSNGYLSASLQICAASLEHNPKLQGRRIDVDTASNVLGFTLTVGLVVGGLVSFGAKSAICGGCNPFIG